MKCTIIKKIKSSEPQAAASEVDAKSKGNQIQMLKSKLATMI